MKSAGCVWPSAELWNPETPTPNKRKRRPSATSRAQSEICVTADYLSSKITDTNKFNHVPGGCNVLYQDGHVEWIRYQVGNEFPINALWAGVCAYVSGNV